jgi:hypothetical protein
MTDFARRTATALLLALLVLPACGKENPAEPPPPPTTESTATPTPEPTASAPASAEAEPPPPAIKETLGKIAKLELMKTDEVGKKQKELLTISEPKEIEEVLEAINIGQSATGILRRCTDDFVLVMLDEAGTAKGEVGLCDAEMLGPEFTPAGGERKGITLADEEAFRKNLKLPKPPIPEK